MVDFFYFTTWSTVIPKYGENLFWKNTWNFSGCFFFRLFVFSVDETYIGNIRSIEMEVKFSDQTLVHLNYHSVPRSIYAELKPHIEVLFNKGWIVHSTSSYSSPVVSVRKKDGSLWLCCNYHKLYSKNLPNLHPLPNIQTSLQKQGGTRYHSILDQGKAYH